MIKIGKEIANIGDETAVMKINDLLDKVDTISGFGEALLSEAEHKLKGTKEMLSINGVDVFPKGKIKFNFKSGKKLDEKSFSIMEGLQHNKYVDKEWLSLMQFSLQYGIRGGSRAIGKAYIGSGRISFQKSYFERYGFWSDIKDTLFHEIGHIWFNSIFYSLGIKEYYLRYERLAVGLFLEANGLDIKPRSWRWSPKIKRAIKEHISDYGGTNAQEAYAELFKLAHHEDSDKFFSESRNQKNELALKVIRDVNRIAWVKIWNSYK